MNGIIPSDAIPARTRAFGRTLSACGVFAAAKNSCRVTRSRKLRCGTPPSPPRGSSSLSKSGSRGGPSAKMRRSFRARNSEDRFVRANVAHAFSVPRSLRDLHRLLVSRVRRIAAGCSPATPPLRQDRIPHPRRQVRMREHLVDPCNLFGVAGGRQPGSERQPIPGAGPDGTSCVTRSRARRLDPPSTPTRSPPMVQPLKFCSGDAVDVVLMLVSDDGNVDMAAGRFCDVLGDVLDLRID